jgi:5-methylcytosine-specific restriction endonuclease McrBC regulatory subunit McrC
MNKKAECEQAIRALAREWFETLPQAAPEHPSWSEFKTWLGEKHYSHYLNFRSVAGADYDAEAWFDDTLGQNWRR